MEILGFVIHYGVVLSRLLLTGFSRIFRFARLWGKSGATLARGRGARGQSDSVDGQNPA